MSFQAYLDTIFEKTGLGPDDFRRIATERGLTKHADILAWAKGELGLGHGHANAIAAVLKQAGGPTPTDEKLDKHFAGKKAAWRAVYDDVIARVTAFGSDVEISPADSYINVNRKGKKFAILQITGERMDIGIKLKGHDATTRFEAAGSWNAMVTHRVRVTAPDQIDPELLAWLHTAYEAAA